MLPLYEMLANAQNGQGLDLLARQFNLNRKQAEIAVEALLPAFSQGLKRSAADPYGVGTFLQALSTGQHAKYFEDATKAFSPQGVAEGNGILGHIFGSKDLSRAVTQQAAQATGLGQDLLKQMLPVIASMIMGGLFKQSTGQLNAGAGASNPLQDILTEMMRQGGDMMGGGARQPRAQAPHPGASPFDNPFGKMLEGMFGGGPSQDRTAQAPQSPYGDNPLGKIFEEMMRGNPMGGGQQRAEPEPQPRAKPEVTPSGRERTPYDDLFGNMFETGAKQRDEYQKGIESIFDQFLKGMDRHR